MRDSHRTAFMASLAAATLTLGMVGCCCNGGVEPPKSEAPAVSAPAPEQPKTETPAPPTTDHPSSEHPSSEHPK